MTAAEELCADAIDVGGFDVETMEVDDVEEVLAVMEAETEVVTAATVATFAADDWEG
eukprot:COSAG01_NODE_37170_length_507_cov_1.598039_1_plen_57_part_00